MDWRKGQEIGLFSVEKNPGERLVPRPGSAGARFGGGGGSKHRRSTWKRVNDPKRSDFETVGSIPYPVAVGDESFFLFIDVYWNPLVNM